MINCIKNVWIDSRGFLASVIQDFPSCVGLLLQNLSTQFYLIPVRDMLIYKAKCLNTLELKVIEIICV